VTDPGDDPLPSREMPFGEHFDDVGTLEHLAEREGIGGMKVAAELIEDELRAKSPRRRIAELLFSLVITVAIFARVIPRLVGVEYHDVFARLQTIDKATIAGLLVFWGFTMWNYGGVVTASLPGLSRLQAIVTNFSGSALANVVPFGGAAGVGATYAQYLSWGFDVPSITLSIMVTGVWNVFAKLGLPIVVLALLLVTNQSSEGLSAAGLIGFAVLVTSVVGLAMIFRSGALAVRISVALQHGLNLVRRLARRAPTEDLPDRILVFRQRTIGLVRRRWGRLTFWMVAYKTSQALLQLLCAKAVGVEGVGWIQIFAVYAFGELLSTIPLTPSGLGFVEGGSAQLMVAFGAQPDAALAAVLFYRTFTYLLEIPLGAVGWVTWATRHSWRKPAGTMAAATVD
jgi:putative heme transporter